MKPDGIVAALVRANDGLRERWPARTMDCAGGVLCVAAVAGVCFPVALASGVSRGRRFIALLPMRMKKP